MIIVNTRVTYTLVAAHTDLVTGAIRVGYTSQLPGQPAQLTEVTLTAADTAAHWRTVAVGRPRDDDLEAQIFSMLQLTGRILK